jgi:hypothetical protein
MVQGKKFCTNCGAVLEKGASFCGSCGQKLSEPVAGSAAKPARAAKSVPTTKPAQEAGAEKLVGIIPAVSRKKGFIGMEAFNVVVTERRMIFAIMTTEMIKEEAQSVSKGKGLAGFFSGVTAGYSLYKRYLDMPPEAALKENPQNFSVDLNRIKKVKVKEGRDLRRGTGVPQYDESHLEVETPGEKYKFVVPHNFLDTAREVMHKAGLY